MVLVLFFGFVLGQNYLMKPQVSPVEQQQSVEEVKPSQSAVEPDVQRSMPAAPLQTAVRTESLVDETSADDDTAASPLDPASVEAVAEQGLATLERIRTVPGAAPLVDEIVEFLQSNPYDEFSLDNLGADENGLVEVNEETMRRMIRNDDIREKWEKLMKLVAKYPEVVSAIQGNEAEQLD